MGISSTIKWALLFTLLAACAGSDTGARPIQHEHDSTSTQLVPRPPASTSPAPGPMEGPPIRIVPQLRHEMKGLRDPQKRFAIAELSHPLRGFCIVDSKHARSAWIIEPSHPRESGFAFSPDGTRLVACSPEGGWVLDLSRDQLKPAPWLKGTVPIFSPDGQGIWVATQSKPPTRWVEPGEADSLRLHALSGQITASYPLQMNIVGRLSLSQDETALIVDGGTGVGLLSRSGGTFRRSRQTINLKTGESTIVDLSDAQHGWGGAHDASFHALNFEDLFTPSGPTLAQQLSEVAWDESTRSLVVTWRGQPRGESVKLWDLKSGEFNQNLAARFLTLQRPGVLAAIGSYRKEERPTQSSAVGVLEWPYESLLTLVQLPKCTPRALPIHTHDWKQVQPSPDGRYLTALITQPVHGFTDRLQIWDLDRSVLFGEVSRREQRISRFQWTTGGHLLVQFASEYGDFRHARWEVFTPAGEAVRVVPGAVGQYISFSPSGDFVAGQMRGDAWMTTVLNAHTGQRVLTVTSPNRCESVFIGEEKLLLAGPVAGDSIRLIRIDDQKVIWETRASGAVQEVSWEQGWSAAVVHYYDGGSNADLLSIHDGHRLAGDDERFGGWRSPTLLDGGRLAIEPMCKSTVLRLRETSTRRTIATLAPFADQEWIVYTPEGLWNGSANVGEWVAFYHGAEPLTAEEVASLRQPEAVKARVAAQDPSRSGRD